MAIVGSVTRKRIAARKPQLTARGPSTAATGVRTAKRRNKTFPAPRTAIRRASAGIVLGKAARAGAHSARIATKPATVAIDAAHLRPSATGVAAQHSLSRSGIGIEPRVRPTGETRAHGTWRTTEATTI